jgi:CO dehydrogenase/acetyl-CoA synthase alpha subunit
MACYAKSPADGDVANHWGGQAGGERLQVLLNCLTAAGGAVGSAASKAAAAAAAAQVAGVGVVNSPAPVARRLCAQLPWHRHEVNNLNAGWA